MRLSPALLSLLALAACARAPLVPVPEAPAGPPVDANGSGAMPCSAEAPTYVESCPFEVTRGAGGGVALQVDTPAGRAGRTERVLLFQDGVWTTHDGSIAESRRTVDTTFVAVDEVEFYAVPHDVLTGNARAEG